MPLQSVTGSGDPPGSNPCSAGRGLPLWLIYFAKCPQHAYLRDDNRNAPRVRFRRCLSTCCRHDGPRSVLESVEKIFFQLFRGKFAQIFFIYVEGGGNSGRIFNHSSRSSFAISLSSTSSRSGSSTPSKWCANTWSYTSKYLSLLTNMARATT